MSLKDELSELLDQQIIDESTARNIEAYLLAKEGSKPRGIILVLSILGGLFIGLGVILIAAHNWDSLSRELKTFLAMLPLLAGQLLCFYYLVNPPQNTVKLESAALFTALAVGESIAMVHQIYHLPTTSIELFLIVWLCLTLPMVYLLEAKAVAFFYVLGLVILGMAQIEYWSYQTYLLLGILPFYVYLIWKKPHNLAMSVMHAAVLAALLSWVLRSEYHEFAFYIYDPMGFVGVLLFVGEYLKRYSPYNVYTVFGLLFITAMLFSAIFMERDFSGMLFTPWFYLYVGCLSVYLYKRHYKEYELVLFYPFLLIALLYFESFTIFADILLFALALFYLIKGLYSNALLPLNYGVLTLMLQIGYRFFDAELSFIFKGLVFISMGVLLLLMNYFIIKNRKNKTA